MNKNQYTFCMLKPDICSRDLIGQVITMIEQKFHIIKIVSKQMTKEETETFYQDHKEKSFFPVMVERICNTKLVGCILKIKNPEQDAVTTLRTLMGATNPSNAEEGTIRKKFAISIDDNSIHGSDSAENVERESKIFFGTNSCCI